MEELDDAAFEKISKHIATLGLSIKAVESQLILKGVIRKSLNEVVMDKVNDVINEINIYKEESNKKYIVR